MLLPFGSKWNTEVKTKCKYHFSFFMGFVFRDKLQNFVFEDKLQNFKMVSSRSLYTEII